MEFNLKQDYRYDKLISFLESNEIEHQELGDTMINKSIITFSFINKDYVLLLTGLRSNNFIYTLIYID